MSAAVEEREVMHDFGVADAYDRLLRAPDDAGHGGERVLLERDLHRRERLRAEARSSSPEVRALLVEIDLLGSSGLGPIAQADRRGDLESEIAALRAHSGPADAVVLPADAGPETDPADGDVQVLALALKASETIAQLEALRPPLALRIFNGDESARGELEAIDARLGEIRRNGELEQLAAAERARVERQEQEATRAEAARETRERLGEAEAQRQEMLDDFLGSLGETRDRLRSLIAADSIAAISEAPSRSDFLGRLVELMSIACIDAGIPLRALGPERPMNARADQLRQMYPLPPARDFGSGAEAAVTGRPCTVCNHEKRSEIEDALAVGTGPTAIAAAHGISRHAVTRHRDHGKGTTS